jgi:hypothetical protein
MSRRSILVGFDKIAVAGFHDYVAGGAGAASAAGVLNVDSAVQRDIQQRLALAVFVVGKLPGFELDRLAGVDESYLGHIFILENPPAILVISHVPSSGETCR